MNNISSSKSSQPKPMHQLIPQNDLHAEVFLRNLKEKDQQRLQQQQRASLMQQQQQQSQIIMKRVGVQERSFIMQDAAGVGAGGSVSQYMMNEVKQLPDKKKSHQELAMEIEELKKKKNRDREEIKKLKVELHKMEQLYKKYKELINAAPVSIVNFNISNTLPFTLNQPGDPAEVAQWISTEELLIETAKIKNLLQREIINQKHSQGAEKQRLDSYQNQNLPLNTMQTPSVSGGKFNVNPNHFKQQASNILCNDCTEPSTNPLSQLQQSDTLFLSGQAKSSLRIQLASLKEKQAQLERQLQEKENELAKLKSKTSDEAKLKAKEELSRAVNVLKHIKKRAGPGLYDVEYGAIIEEVELLGREDHVLPQNEEDQLEKKASISEPIETNKESYPLINNEISVKEDNQVPILKQQEAELQELLRKVKDLEEELALPDKDFERKLTERLRDEIRANKARLDEEFRRELQEEKRRIVNQAAKEKEDLRSENKQLNQEIARLKILMRHGGAVAGIMPQAGNK